MTLLPAVAIIIIAELTVIRRNRQYERGRD
jgi:hypothetical protein